MTSANKCTCIKSTAKILTLEVSLNSLVRFVGLTTLGIMNISH